REERAEKNIVAARRPARFHRQCAGRSEPMVDRALDGLASAETQTHLRGAVRPLLRRTLSPRHQIPALASGQRFAPVYLRSSKSFTESRLGRVALCDLALAAYRHHDTAHVRGVAA